MYFLHEEKEKCIASKRRLSLENALIGDNIGDAFKDIAGPSIIILIKFSAYLSLIIINFINL